MENLTIKQLENKQLPIEGNSESNFIIACLRTIQDGKGSKSEVANEKKPKKKYLSLGLHFTYLSSRYGESTGKLTASVMKEGRAVTPKTGNVVIFHKGKNTPFVFTVDFANVETDVFSQIIAKVKPQPRRWTDDKGVLHENNSFESDIQEKNGIRTICAESHKLKGNQFTAWMQENMKSNPVALAFMAENLGIDNANLLANAKQKCSDIRFDASSITHQVKELIKTRKIESETLINSLKPTPTTNLTETAKVKVPPISKEETAKVENKKAESKVIKGIKNAEIDKVGNEIDTLLATKAKKGKSVTDLKKEAESLERFRNAVPSSK